MNIFKELCIKEGKDRMNEALVYSIASAYTFFEQGISVYLSRYNLTPAKFNILLMVQHKGKDTGVAQNELSKLLLVTTSNITRMVDKLERDNYVHRFPKKGDRRVNLIKITEKGTALLEQIWPGYQELINNIVGSMFSNREKKMIIDLLQRLNIKT